MKVKKCPKCLGTKVERTEYKFECEHCSGYGYTMNVTGYTSSDGMTEVFKRLRCSACDGTGKIKSELKWECSGCDGTGFVVE
jgi:DnaJ-class molecular chaperone